MSTTLTEFISEIETDLSSYAESGDINTSSIKRWVITELRRFGNNILSVQEKYLDVNNSQVTLPDNFKSLKLALKIDVIGSKKNNCDTIDLKESLIQSRRIEQEAYFNDVTLEYVATNKSKIIEEVITLDSGEATVYYNPEWLKVVKGIRGSGIATDCLNISKDIRNKNVHEITINNLTLNTSFNKGQIYIQFYGLDTDEDGEIIIPDIMHLDKYLEYYCKARLTENLIANGRNPQALAQLLPVFKQEADKQFSNAMTASKMSAIADGSWVAKSRVQNRRQMNRFNLPRI